MAQTIPISENPEESGDEMYPNDEQGSTGKITNDAPPIAGAVVEIPEAILQEYRASRKQQNRESRITRWIAVAAALSAWVYAGIATFQWCAMQSQLKETRAAIKLSRKELQISKRPWIVVTAVTTDTPFTPGREWRTKVWLKNTGDTPALGFSASVYPQVIPFRKTAPPCEYASDKSLFTFGPGVERHYDAIFGPQPQAVNERIMKDPPEQTMYICGMATYRDILSCYHWTLFCAFYDVQTGIFTACPEGDAIDENFCEENNNK